MLALPLRLQNSDKYDLYVILQPDNIERILKYDPAEVVQNLLPAEWQALRVRNVIITYATDADLERFYELCRTEGAGSGLRYLSRGYAYRPDRGDVNGPYIALEIKRK